MAFLKLKTRIRRFLSKILEMHRPASYPYISGDGFRAIANFTYDQFADFNPGKVMAGDKVFVRTNYLLDFFEKIHPLINAKYVLISGNEDSTVTSEYRKYIDSKIIHWYAQNLFFEDSKVSPLPIGIQNFQIGHDENFIHAYEGIKNEPSDKANRILYAFTHSENVPERVAAATALKASPLADYVSLPRTEYYRKLSGYKFVASPSGGGLDCHRTWEGFYFKVIPILLKSPFSMQIKNLGLPVLLVDQWSDIKNLTSESLSEFYEQNKSLFNSTKLYLPYWYDQFTKI